MDQPIYLIRGYCSSSITNYPFSVFLRLFLPKLFNRMEKISKNGLNVKYLCWSAECSQKYVDNDIEAILFGRIKFNCPCCGELTQFELIQNMQKLLFLSFDLKLLVLCQFLYYLAKLVNDLRSRRSINILFYHRHHCYIYYIVFLYLLLQRHKIRELF